METVTITINEPAASPVIIQLDEKPRGLTGPAGITPQIRENGAAFEVSTDGGNTWLPLVTFEEIASSPAFQSIYAGLGTDNRFSGDNVFSSLTNNGTTATQFLNVFEDSFLAGGLDVNGPIEGIATNNRLFNQTATSDASIMTRGLCDARYTRGLMGYAPVAQDVTNSNTFTDSSFLTVSLDAGTWYFETHEFVGSSDPATGASRSRLVFTGAGTMTGTKLRAGGAITEPLNVSPTWTGTGESVDSSTASGASYVIRRGRIVVTSAGNLKVQFSQNVAVPGHYARMIAGSFLRAWKV